MEKDIFWNRRKDLFSLSLNKTKLYSSFGLQHIKSNLKVDLLNAFLDKKERTYDLCTKFDGFD